MAGRIRGLFLGIICMLSSAVAAFECAPLPDVAVASTDLEHAEGLAWRVTTAGGASNVLLGTMHIADPRITAIADDLHEVLSQSDHFVMEVVLDLSAMAGLQGAMFDDDEQSLEADLGAPLFEHIATMMAARGVPGAMLAKMKPWAVYSALSMPAGAAGLPLDLQLMLAAQTAGIEVSGLESVDEQIAVFESVPRADQIAMLRELACHYPVYEREVEQMIKSYAARDLAALVELSLRHVDTSRTAFLDALLWSRNRTMLKRMLPLLDAGGAFIAVGALHLPGQRGLLELLLQSGHAVELIE